MKLLIEGYQIGTTVEFRSASCTQRLLDLTVGFGDQDEVEIVIDASQGRFIVCWSFNILPPYLMKSVSGVVRCSWQLGGVIEFVHRLGQDLPYIGQVVQGA